MTEIASSGAPETNPPETNQPGFDLGPAEPAGYRVLARKYRPSTFDDLIGQDAMVRTISNAFETGRVPQAWILTGVRGVGKTTTARILARALNYELPDGSATRPTITMPALGVHCQAIMESRHIDVLEMDAASHTGVDDVRQITDGVRYAPASARYKVYIIDEVHMLSEKAFNAFLKTLEEPPPHAKFIFATTEIRKVPVTVLSRCQRFDLRRVETDVLARHLAGIMAREHVEAEAEALGLIARAAEGSVRDSLSLLDQAIAHAAGPVRADDVRQMLGLADRTRVIDLFESLARGDLAAAFAEFRDQYATGADPVIVLGDLAEFVNFVARIKIVPATADNVSLGETERVRGREFAVRMSMKALSRMWQMLIKGIGEVQMATRPVAAAEMVLIRIAYAADLPTPDELIRAMQGEERASAEGAAASAPAAAAPPRPRSEIAPPVPRLPQSIPARSAPDPSTNARAAPEQSMWPQTAEPMRQARDGEPVARTRVATFADLVALAVEQRDLPIKTALECDVRLVRMEDGRLEINLEPTAPRGLVHDLSSKLCQWTGRRWLVIVSGERGAPTLRAQAQARKEELARELHGDPRVRAVLARFPGAAIVDVRRVGATADAAAGEPAEEWYDGGGAGEE
jgi:DNA polymerase-3 subunit gamma/tau